MNGAIAAPPERPPVPWMLRLWWERLASGALGENPADARIWVLDDLWRSAARQAGEWAA